MGMPCDLAAILAVARARGAAGDRGRRLRDRQRDPRGDGRWERIGGPHGDVACFSFHPRKVISTGDGGMITTANAEWDAQVPAAAPARHERARHGPPRREPGDLRGVPDRRLQLPHDRHPGRRRPRAAEAPARDRPGAPRDGRALPRAARRRSPASCCRTSPTGRAATGRASACACPTAATSARSCSRCSTTASPRAAASCAAIARLHTLARTDQSRCRSRKRHRSGA